MTLESVLTTDELVGRAWEQSYLNPEAELALGREIVRRGGPGLAAGWLHVALAEVRTGDREAGRRALDEARQAYTAARDANGVAWCDETLAVLLRLEGDAAASARLQFQLDQRNGVVRDDMHRFFSHNSRAITAKLLGHPDAALRHFYAARQAALLTGMAGPRITALCNLGGYHHDLYNLDDARRLSEESLSAALQAASRPALTTSATNLISIYHAAGEPQRARAMVDFIVQHEAELTPGALIRYSGALALGHYTVGQVDAALERLRVGASTNALDSDRMTLCAWVEARCRLAKSDATGARAVAEAMLARRHERHLLDQQYDTMELHKALADACEQMGDLAAALRCMRQVHEIYEQLVGRSARARYIALEVRHQLSAAQHERDLALDSHRSADDDRRRLAALNQALQAQIEQTELLHAQLREQALNDPLTGLHNRRFLFESAPRMLELARRQNTPLCVVLMDLDHFKLLNDTYGHAAGDLVLRRFAKLLNEMLRRSDIVCRHGGEEFVALMPELDGDGAQAVLTRLLAAFQALPPEPGHRRTPNASFSAGIALFPRHGSTLEQLLSRADRALYAAKHRGRARIEQAPRTGFGTLG